MEGVYMRSPFINPHADNTPIRTGTFLDLFCQGCWRVWRAEITKNYKDTQDFNARNLLVCPWCRGQRNRAAMATDAKIMTNGGV